MLFNHFSITDSTNSSGFAEVIRVVRIALKCSNDAVIGSARYIVIYKLIDRQIRSIGVQGY